MTDNGEVLSEFRADIVAATASCLMKDDCAAIAFVDALTACLNKSADVVVPSAVANRFCTTLVAAQARCGMTISDTLCISQKKVYSDSTLNGASACLTMPCDMIYECEALRLK